jgi:hypothetical protein
MFPRDRQTILQPGRRKRGHAKARIPADKFCASEYFPQEGRIGFPPSRKDIIGKYCVYQSIVDHFPEVV